MAQLRWILPPQMSCAVHAQPVVPTARRSSDIAHDGRGRVHVRDDDHA